MSPSTLQASPNPSNASPTIASRDATSASVSFLNSLVRRLLDNFPLFCRMNIRRFSASPSGISTVFMMRRAPGHAGEDSQFRAANPAQLSALRKHREIVLPPWRQNTDTDRQYRSAPPRFAEVLVATR